VVTSEEEPYPIFNLLSEPLFDANDEPHGSSAVTIDTSKVTQQELTNSEVTGLRKAEALKSDVAGPSEAGRMPGCVQVTSNVILANEAFNHVVSCFDKLIDVLGYIISHQKISTLKLVFFKNIGIAKESISLAKSYCQRNLLNH